MLGQSCDLYKTCGMCGSTKWYKEFPSKGYRRRRSYCRECKNLYSFDTNQLEVSDIEVRVKLPSKRRISYTVSYEEAKILVKEGVAGIVHEKLIHKFYDKQEQKKNSELGKAGERLVLEYEKKVLLEAVREDLIEQVEHVSETKGDGLGYDIKSVTIDDKVKFIEVKTTTGGINTEFFIEESEV